VSSSNRRPTNVRPTSLCVYNQTRGRHTQHLIAKATHLPLLPLPLALSLSIHFLYSSTPLLSFLPASLPRPPPPYSYALGSLRLCSHLSMFSGTDTYSENLSSAMDTTSLLALAAAGAAATVRVKEKGKESGRRGGASDHVGEGRR